MAQKDFLFGVAVGVAVAATAPLVLLALAGTPSRPVSTALRRGNALLRSKSVEAVAELGEIVEDMFAEIRTAPPAAGETTGSPAQPGVPAAKTKAAEP